MNRIIFTRHAERLPSGELSPRGIEQARLKGVSLSLAGKRLISYSSDHPSKRAYDTALMIAEASNLTLSKPVVSEVPDLSYDVLKPDLIQHLAAVKEIIDEATLKKVGLSTDRDSVGKLIVSLDELPKDQQIKIAPIRQRLQSLGFEYWMGQPSVIHRFAICLAYRLESEMKKMVEAKDGTIVQIVGHGCFAEALFKEAGGIVIDDKSGGYLKPLESFFIDIIPSEQIPENVFAVVERNNGSVTTKINLSSAKLEDLKNEYLAWRK